MSQTQKLLVKVDRREWLAAQTLRKYANVLETTLDLGDFATEKCIIERKTFDDFVASMVDGRLFDQTKRMYETGEPCFLIIEGLFEHRHDVKDKQILGAIASTLVRSGVPTLIFICREKELEREVFEDSMYIAVKILEKVEEGKYLRPRAAYKYYRPKAPRKVTVVKKMFNIPAVVAARLLIKFKTIQGICNAEMHELRSVEGIGDVRARNIYNIVR